MIQRELERRSGAGYRLTLIAAAFIIVLLVGSMMLIPFALRSLRNSNVGGPGQVPTVVAPAKSTATASNTDCPHYVPSVNGIYAGGWRDDSEQAACLAHQETPLNFSRTIDNHKVDFVAAYADSSRLVILYIEHIDPRGDAVSFMSATLQDGTTLPGGASHSYGDVQAHLLYVQVMFDTISLPGSTTVLHVQSIKDAMSGNAIPLGFTTPFHNKNH